MNLFGDDDVIYDDDLPDNDADSSGDGSSGFDFSETAESSSSLPESTEPKYNPLCLGHDALETQFLELFNQDKIPHAMIFSGVKGTGKATMAFRLARFLLKNGKVASNQDSLFGEAAAPLAATSLQVDVDDPVFRRVASGGHLDILYIEREVNPSTGKRDAGLKVDNLRRINTALRKTAAEGGWRIVIVDDADTMNRSAQNAILKILEEPPPRVLIVLVAHRLGMLIPTILSRSRVFRFSPLADDVVQAIISKHGHHYTGKDFERLMALAGGSAGKALDYAEGEGLQMLSQLFLVLESAPAWDWRELHKLADSLGGAQADKNYRMFADLLCWIFRQVLLAKARGESALPKYLNHAALEEIFRRYSLERLIALNDDLASLFERTEFSNLDRRDAVRNAFLVISQ